MKRYLVLMKKQYNSLIIFFIIFQKHSLLIIICKTVKIFIYLFIEILVYLLYIKNGKVLGVVTY